MKNVETSLKDASASTNPRIDENGQVISLRGQKIPGLYAAGNAAKISAPLFALDTSKTELVLTVSASAFNPAKSAIKLTPIVNTNSQTGSSVTSYDLQIKNIKAIKKLQCIEI